MAYYIAKTLQLKDTYIEFEEKVEELTNHNQKALVYYGKLDTCPSVVAIAWFLMAAALSA